MDDRWPDPLAFPVEKKHLNASANVHGAPSWHSRIMLFAMASPVLEVRG